MGHVSRFKVTARESQRRHLACLERRKANSNHALCDATTAGTGNRVRFKQLSRHGSGVLAKQTPDPSSQLSLSPFLPSPSASSLHIQSSTGWPSLSYKHFSIVESHWRVISHHVGAPISGPVKHNTTGQISNLPAQTPDGLCKIKEFGFRELTR
ncbi:hypothetical protein Sjap_022028 [Stephania japonica]|uniref:Uncharacterized protein n=1 Tax=Stephania japonica TaxID=461633 RepID=A0AAP0EN37_9MAGN